MKTKRMRPLHVGQLAAARGACFGGMAAAGYAATLNAAVGQVTQTANQALGQWLALTGS